LPCSTLFPYTTLFRSWRVHTPASRGDGGAVTAHDQRVNVHATSATDSARNFVDDLRAPEAAHAGCGSGIVLSRILQGTEVCARRSEEHTSELQSRGHL